VAFKYSMDSFVKTDFARSYNFKILISGVKNFPEIHDEMVVSCTTPSCTTEAIPTNWCSAPIELPGKPTFEPITLTIRENIGGDVYMGFYNWFSEIVDLRNGTLTMLPFEQIITGKSMEIISLGMNNNQKFTYNLQGVHLESLPSTTYTYEDSGIIIYEVPIKYLNFTLKK